MALAKQYGIPIKTQANPDLLFTHTIRSQFIPIECKLSGFGPTSNNAQQANVLLTATGDHIASRIGFTPSSGWKSHVLYALADDQEEMLATLNELTGRLEATSTEVNVSSTAVIKISEDGIYLRFLPREICPLDLLRTATSEWKCVKPLSTGEDPRFLYLLPVDPSIDLSNSSGIQVLEERLRMALVSAIGSRLGQANFVMHEDVLLQAALEVWDYWKDTAAKSGLMRLAVRKYLRKVFAEMERMGAKIDYRQCVIEFSGITSGVASNLRSYLLSRDFARGQINLQQVYYQLSLDELFEAEDPDPRLST